ncbi:MAG: helix-hairpin-helix domain-containing protein, partial [bacterium]|nr:helix-hairpin-helix domain-containing protein [bacterium]
MISIRKVPINSAKPSALLRIRGVNEVLIRRILEYRRQGRRFETALDLRNIKGIGPV